MVAAVIALIIRQLPIKLLSALSAGRLNVVKDERLTTYNPATGELEIVYGELVTVTGGGCHCGGLVAPPLTRGSPVEPADKLTIKGPAVGS